MAVEPQVQQFIDFIRDEMPRRIKTNPNNLPDAQKLLVSVSGTLEVIYKTLAELDIAIKSDVDTALSSKEPTISAGTSSQYYRGDKTFQPLNTNAVTESTDKRYLSDAQKTIATQAATSTLSGYLSSTDWSTFNGKQAALVSGTNIKTVNGSSLLGNGDLVVSATEVNDNVFRIVDSDNISRKIAFDAVNVANSTTVTLTVPNKNIDFGDLPSVATNDDNVLGGTRCRILGGSSNTVSGTDVLAVGSANLITSSAQDGLVVTGLRHKIRGNTEVRLPRSTSIEGLQSGNIGDTSYAGGIIIRSYFKVTKPAGTQTVSVADFDGIKPLANIGKPLSSFQSVACHKLTITSAFGTQAAEWLIAVRESETPTILAKGGIGSYLPTVTATASSTGSDDSILRELTISIASTAGTVNNDIQWNVFLESFYTAAAPDS